MATPRRPVSVQSPSGQAAPEASEPSLELTLEIVPDVALTVRTEPGEIQEIARPKISNDLTQARYSMSARAQKFILYAISLIDHENDKELKGWYTIHAASFAEWAGVDEYAVRRDFFSPPRGQKKRSICNEVARELLVLPNFFHDGRNRYMRADAPWFSVVVPEHEEGPCAWVDVKFNRELAPLLLGMNDHYFRVNKVIIREFDSRYAIRLYEWVERWSYKVHRNKHRVRLPIEEIRTMLGTDQPTVIDDKRTDLSTLKGTHVWRDNRLYKRQLEHIGHLRAKALDVAVREVNKWTDYEVKVFPVRRAGGKDRPGCQSIIAFDIEIELKSRLEVDGQPAGTPDSPAEKTPAKKTEHSIQEEMMLSYPPGNAGSSSERGTNEVSVPEPPAENPTTVSVEAGATQNEADTMLAEMVANLKKFYRLTGNQAGKLVGDARQGGGCETPEDCAAYFKFHHEKTQREVRQKGTKDKMAIWFIASVQNNFGDFRLPRQGKVKAAVVEDPFAKARAREKKEQAAARAAAAEETLPTPEVATATVPVEAADDGSAGLDMEAAGGGCPSALAWRIKEFGDERGRKMHRDAQERHRASDERRLKEEADAAAMRTN